MTAPEDDGAHAGTAGPPLEDAPTAGLLEGGAAGHGPRIRPGLVLAERYRVMRFLAQGGMGEIYEVEDLQLGDRVALKTVRAGSASDPLALERFKREIQLARRVTHPNVCRIFEFGLHRGADATPLAFLTMELLPGETLLERLRREGRLTPAQALPLVVQMCAGLDAAHRAGVVHRDFKSSNVLLVPTPDGGARAVVTDFGLAQLAARETTGLPLAQDIIGTLDYMAPEQIEGHEPTPAVDIYALGVVMYEMLTAARPFGAGPQASGVTVRRADTPARSPRIHVPDIDPVWERTILLCLERDPRDRAREAADVARALSGEAKHPRRGAFTGLAVAAALLAAALVGYQALAPDRRAPPARRSVAVLPFKNLSGQAETAWLATAFSEMLTTELAATEKLRLVSGEDVARMRVELKLPEADTLAKDTLRRIQANLGSDIVVLGSYLEGAGQLRLDVRVQDAGGETLAGVTETGPSADVLDLVTRSGRRLRQSLGLPALTPAQAGELRASLPATPEAARLYAAGLDRLRAFDALAGRDLLARAVAADPKFPLAYAALADALTLLGYDQRASDAVKQAFDLSAHLPREERLAVEGRYQETLGAWDQAAARYRVLFSLFPDNVEHGLRLAQALRAAGKGQEALETLATLRQLPAPLSGDPRIDVVEAEVAQWLGDFRKQREAAARAAARGEQRGAHLLTARSRVLESYAAGRLGLEAEARRAAGEARRIYGETGDKGGLAWALNRTGNVFFQQGHLVDARALYDDSLRLFEEVGYRGGILSITSNIAGILRMQGELLPAKRSYESVASISEEAGDKRTLAMALSNISILLLDTGELAQARAAHDRAVTQVRSLGDRSLEAGVLRDKADILASAGELSEAKGAYTEAHASLKRLGNLRYAAAALFGLGNVLRDGGDLEAARAAHEQALALRRELGDRIGIASSQVALARLGLDTGGDFDGSAAGAALAADVFTKEKARDAEAEARGALALLHAARGRSSEAREASRQASSLAASSQNPRVRLGAVLVRAQIEGSRPEALAELRGAVAEAGRRKLLGLELEARLALARAPVPNPRSARAELERIESDAKRSGFQLVARRAAAVGAASR